MKKSAVAIILATTVTYAMSISVFAAPEPEFEPNTEYDKWCAIDYTIEDIGVDLVVTVSAMEDDSEMEIRCKFYGDEQLVVAEKDGEDWEILEDKTGFMQIDTPLIIEQALAEGEWYMMDGETVSEGDSEADKEEAKLSADTESEPNAEEIGEETESESIVYSADYDVDFKYSKKEIDHYKKDECDEQGTIVTMEYDTPAYLYNELLNVDETLHKKLYVYLPYNYDETQKYNILYLMHGGGENQEYWLGNENGDKPVYGNVTRNVLDNMIKEGLCEPLIVVGPTFYSDVEGMTIPEETAKEYGENVLGEPEIANTTSLHTQFFQYELRNNIIPLVESTYSTYAEGDTSEENLIATRDHRAYAGLSMGSMTSVHSILEGCTDIISYVGSFSGIKANFDNFKSIMEEKFADYDMNFWYNGEGVEDIAFEEHMAFHNNVTSQMTDKFVDGENYAMVVLEDGNHAWASWITDLYNALLVFFK